MHFQNLFIAISGGWKGHQGKLREKTTWSLNEICLIPHSSLIIPQSSYLRYQSQNPVWNAQNPTCFNLFYSHPPLSCSVFLSSS